MSENDEKTFDRPLLPRRQSFDEERERVPAAIVDTLRDALRDHPEWMPLTPLEERRVKDSPIGLDKLQRANIRAEKFLNECHGDESEAHARFFEGYETLLRRT
jgi:hypothetical protein